MWGAVRGENGTDVGKCVGVRGGEEKCEERCEELLGCGGGVGKSVGVWEKVRGYVGRGLDKCLDVGEVKEDVEEGERGAVEGVEKCGEVCRGG